MSTSAWSVALIGTEAALVEVEAALGNGLPRTVLIGMPDTALYEARDRCKAAVASVGIGWPDSLVTINLTPASLPKAGSHYDLAIAAAVLTAAKIAPTTIAENTVFLGELGLDGRVRSVTGLLPALLGAKRAGFERVVVPYAQLAEAQLVEGLTIWPAESIADLLEVMNGRPVLLDEPKTEPKITNPIPQPDLADVIGQPHACWALEVAAAGGHHIFLRGAPGVGKTMLAERLPGLLADLTTEEALEVSAIHSLVGADLSSGLITRPPFSNPHNNASLAALIGGGAKLARPGAISLAHRGVLFLDEAPEFSTKCLDALRTPLESGYVSIARSQGQVRFPARFQLVLAANPCPCGHYGIRAQQCSCTPMAIRRYSEKLSGPILDRIDLHVQMNPVTSLVAKANQNKADSTAIVAERVAEARARTRHRLRGTSWTTNAEIPGYFLKKLPGSQALDFLDSAMKRGALSARGVDKVIRVAWTLADLAGHSKISKEDVMAAVGLRKPEGALAA